MCYVIAKDNQAHVHCKRCLYVLSVPVDFFILGKSVELKKLRLDNMGVNAP